MRLNADFYGRPTLTVARDLLGCKLVRRFEDGSVVSGFIVEVEGYLWQNDPACHAARGCTPRNRTMFESFGKLYVYAIHARWCMNVVTEVAGKGAAVLIRALQPIEGLERMRLRRKVDDRYGLTNGPAKCCEALGIDKALDGTDLLESNSVWIESFSHRNAFSIATSTRIGIREGAELPYRYFIDNNRFVSGRVRDHSSGRKESL